MDDLNDPVEYSLVMPFVVCTSKGGPYDDDAFAAGFKAGQLDGLLQRSRAQRLEDTVRTALVPQLDLLAMRYGWVMEAEPYEGAPDEWTSVTFRRPGTSAP